MKLKRIPRLSRLIFLTLMLIGLSCSSYAQSPPPGNKKILILVGYQYGLPVPDAFTKSAIASLKAKGISADDIFIEYLDLLRNPQAEYRQKLAELLHRKLNTYILGVIVAFSASAVRFLENEGRDLFPAAPLIINTGTRTTEWKGVPREVHTMTSVMDFSGTLQYALALLPKTQRVIVTLGRDHEGIAARAHESLAGYESKLAIEYTSELSYEEMLQRVTHAPADTIILNSSYFGDKTGRNFIPAEVSKKIAGNANAPVFVMYDNLVGNGVLGGSVLRSEAVATVLADLALEIMHDKQTSKLSDLISTPVIPMFDWTQMQRWGLDMDKLPPESLVLNQPVTLWGQYKEFVIAVVLALLLLSVLVLLLYGQNRLRRKAEILARESEERFRVLLEHAPEAVILLNIDQHKLIDANSQAKRFSEGARQALLNLQLPGMTEHGVAESIDAEIKQALDGGEVMLEKYMNMDGEARYWEVRFVRLPAARQSLLRASFTDISERKQTQQALARLNDELEERVKLRTADLQKTMDQLHHFQEELLQSKKLAALGGMVAGVAHELNTPIGNCLLTTTTQSHDLQELERAMAHGLKRSVLQAYMQNSTTALAITEKNLLRASELVACFKQVAADHRTSERSHFSLRALCNECLQTIAAHRPTHEYQIVQDIPQDIELDSYSGLLGQVLENLIVNAMVHGYDDRGHGTIHIAATCSQAWVKIEVSDQGLGIAAESQGRIFDPFFTSKMGRGSVGLGLHIVHNIVSTVLAGRISVTSKVGEGTIFTLDIPCTAPQANARQIEQLFVE